MEKNYAVEVKQSAVSYYNELHVQLTLLRQYVSSYGQIDPCCSLGILRNSMELNYPENAITLKERSKGG